jgi:hypothetical protein
LLFFSCLSQGAGTVAPCASRPINIAFFGSDPMKKFFGAAVAGVLLLAFGMIGFAQPGKQADDNKAMLAQS